MPFHIMVFESLLVWPLPWDKFALGDPVMYVVKNKYATFETTQNPRLDISQLRLGVNVEE